MNEAERLQPKTKVRDPWLDNVKGFLMICVVLGHMLWPIAQDSNIAMWLYYVVNGFHMPAFMILSGYLSKRRVQERDNVAVINHLLTPYLLSQLMIYFVGCLVPGALENVVENSTLSMMSFFKPIYALWYIFGMILFNFFCIQVQPQRHPAIWMVVSVAACLVMGIFPTVKFMYLSKMICFFPFFLLGLLLDKSVLERLRKPGILTVLGALVLIAWCAVMYFFRSDINRSLFYMMSRYSDIFSENAILKGIIGRGCLVLAAPLMLFGLLTVMPRKRTILTRLGERSMYIYILHIFCVYIMRWITGDRMNANLWQKILVVAVAIAIPFLLASNPVRKVFHRILEPKADIRNLFTPKQQQ